MLITKVRQYINQELTWLKLSYKFWWAHHPTCDPYSSQRFDIFGLSLCQGCAILTVSAFLSFLLTLVLGISIFTPLVLIYITVFLGVAIIDGMGLGRNYKRLARASIGLSLGTAFAQIFLLPLIQGLFIIFVIIISFYGYKVFRSQKSSRDLCQTCPELKDAPRCTGIIHQYEANLKYQELILPVIDEKVILERIAMNDGLSVK